MEYCDTLNGMSPQSLRLLAEGTLQLLDIQIKQNEATIKDLDSKVRDINVNLDEIRDFLEDDEDNCAIMENLKFCRQRFIEIIVAKTLTNIKHRYKRERLHAQLSK